MLRGILLALLFVASPVLAEDQQHQFSTLTTAGGLSCFTVTPADPAKGAAEFKTCDQLCAERAAACTGVTSTINPPLSCSNGGSLLTCRCCAVAVPK